MLTSLTDLLFSATTDIISALGYLGIALLMAVESACIPLPSEIIMPFAGYLVSSGRFDLALVATAGAIGCNLGSTLAYAVGWLGGRPAVDRWGRYVLLDTAKLDMAHRWFERYGSVTVFVFRLLPLVRSFVSLPAGVARMPFWHFQIATFFGSWPWCWALAWAGMRLGEAWHDNPALKRVMHGLDGVVVLAILAAVIWAGARHLRIARQGR